MAEALADQWSDRRFYGARCETLARPGVRPIRKVGLHEVHEKEEWPLGRSRLCVAVKPLMREAILEPPALVGQRLGIMQQAEQRPKDEVPAKRILGGVGQGGHDREIFEPSLQPEARADH